MTIDNKLRILLIGPLMDRIGGTSVSFRLLIHELNKLENLEIIVLSVEGIRGGGLMSLPRFISLAANIFVYALKNDIVSLHASVTGVPYIGIIVFIICKIVRRPIVYRMFGGMDHNGLTGLKKTIACLFARNVEIYLAQTKLLVNSAIGEGFDNVKWFPTCRPVPMKSSPIKGNCRRFIFVGQLRHEKGLKELSEAAERLPDGLEVHVWGPWTGLPKNYFEQYNRIKFMGCLRADEVSSKLLQYDALVLPTYLKAEGYSGVIFEAYAAGLPVIATRWLALPEIVIDEQTGLLVMPNDTESLLQAMIRLSSDDELYHKVCVGANEFVKEFSTELQAERFFNYCRLLEKK